MMSKAHEIQTYGERIITRHLREFTHHDSIFIYLFDKKYWYLEMADGEVVALQELGRED